MSKNKTSTIFTYQKILKAYFFCRKHKRQALSALAYELNLEKNLGQLIEQLQNKTYLPQSAVYFIVTKPKPREIFASEFGDRITHHLLINEVEKIWEKNIFITDSYACRKGKGHHFALQRVKNLAKKYRYYGQFDISNFFSSIDKNILFEIFAKVIKTQAKPEFWKNNLLWLTKIIIFTDPTQDFFYKGNQKLKKLVPAQKSLFNQEPEIGLPIGNLSSQFLANVYLNELDQFVNKKLKITAYARYVDDFLIFSNSKTKVIQARNQIKEFLKTELKLTLHPKKQQIQTTWHGIPFVGYFIKPGGAQVRRNVVKTLKNKLFYAQKLKNLPQIITSLNSYYGHFIHANSYRLRKHLFKQHLSQEFHQYLWVKGHYQSFWPTKKFFAKGKNLSFSKKK